MRFLSSPPTTQALFWPQCNIAPTTGTCVAATPTFVAFESQKLASEQALRVAPEQKLNAAPERKLVVAPGRKLFVASEPKPRANNRVVHEETKMSASSLRFGNRSLHKAKREKQRRTELNDKVVSVSVCSCVI
jgi:hypothetical protein